jgi:hypothetical protein
VSERATDSTHSPSAHATANSSALLLLPPACFLPPPAEGLQCKSVIELSRAHTCTSTQEYETDTDRARAAEQPARSFARLAHVEALRAPSLHGLIVTARVNVVCSVPGDSTRQLLAVALTTDRAQPHRAAVCSRCRQHAVKAIRYEGFGLAVLFLLCCCSCPCLYLPWTLRLCPQPGLDHPWCICVPVTSALGPASAVPVNLQVELYMHVQQVSGDGARVCAATRMCPQRACSNEPTKNQRTWLLRHMHTIVLCYAMQHACSVCQHR